MTRRYRQSSTLTPPPPPLPGVYYFAGTTTLSVVVRITVYSMQYETTLGSVLTLHLFDPTRDHADTNIYRLCSSLYKLWSSAKLESELANLLDFVFPFGG